MSSLSARAASSPHPRWTRQYGPGMSYVYLLCDPRKPHFPENVFYVGKGTGSRADAHRIAAITSDVEENDPAKLALLREIDAAGVVPEIRVIANKDLSGISDDQAFDIEAALIAVLGLNTLVNQVSGHRLTLIPSELFNGEKRDAAELPADVRAVYVPVSGLWGGVDYAGTILSAQDGEVWENARRTWSRFGSDRVDRIAAAAGTLLPVLLLALARDPAGSTRNVVVGVFELSRVHKSNDPRDQKGGGTRTDGSPIPLYSGWVFERVHTDEESDWTSYTRRVLLGRELTWNGSPVERPQDRSYLGDWSRSPTR